MNNTKDTTARRRIERNQHVDKRNDDEDFTEAISQQEEEENKPVVRGKCGKAS